VELLTAIQNRPSRRIFTDKPLSLDELSLSVWATQGVRQRLDQATALRTVPSAGARHALETYLCVFHVEELEPAVYR
jgi:nitroreductase